MSPRAWGIVAGLVVVGAAVAWWRTPRAPAVRYRAVTADILAHIDPNGDGRVDATEWARVAGEGDALATYDLDRDGVLDAVEVEALFLRAVPPRMPTPGR